MPLHHRDRNSNEAEVPLNASTENGAHETQEVEMTEADMNFKQKVIFFFQNITLEPTAFLFIVPYMLNTLTTSNLSLEKACRVNLNFSDEICTAIKNQELGNQNEYEREVQRLVTTAMSYKTFLTATIPCVLGLFVGPWQDKTGHRKIFLIICIIGQIISCANCMLNVFFLNELNLNVLVFSDATIDALSGGMCIFTLTFFAFISSITSEKSRTFRMGMANFCLTVGFPIGTSASGFVLKYTGYYGSYGLAMALFVVNLTYTIFVLKDPKRTPENKKHDKQGVGHFFRTFFDLANIRDTLKVVFKKGPNKRRLRIIMLLCVVTILFGPMFGEMSVLYMSTRYRFNWDEVKFSLFQTYNFITHTIGTIFSITVFSKYLQWHDSMLGIISTVSKIAASFVYCFAPNEKIFYIAPMVEILNGTSLLAIRSIVSKLVQPNELGKVNSIFGLTENLMPLVYVPLYTKVYTATMEVLPGAVFLMGASMTLPAVVAFIWLFTEHRRVLKKKPLDHETEIPLNSTS